MKHEYKNLAKNLNSGKFLNNSTANPIKNQHSEKINRMTKKIWEKFPIQLNRNKKNLDTLGEAKGLI